VESAVPGAVAHKERGAAVKDYRPGLMVVYAGIQSIIAENAKDQLDTRRGPDDKQRTEIVEWGKDCIRRLEEIFADLDAIDECLAEIETRRRVS